MQGVLCTGRQERISAVAPTWAARASSEMLPIATVAPATTHGSRGRGQRRGRLVECGHNTLLKCIGRGESDSLERVGGHVDARCTLRASGLGGLERGDGSADLRLIAVVLGAGRESLVTVAGSSSVRARSSYGARMASSSALQAAARTLCTAEKPIPQPHRAPPQSSQPQRERNPCGRRAQPDRTPRPHGSWRPRR